MAMGEPTCMHKNKKKNEVKERILMDQEKISNGYEERYGTPMENEIKEYIRNTEEEKQMGQETAGRFSAGKIRHDLIPPWALTELAKVYTYGTQKYDDDNWWKGLKWKRDVFGCILRHVWKWMRGERFDDESGVHHLAHAAWNCLTLMSYERHNIGVDDRIPYELDLMDKDERIRRIDMWKKCKGESYNGLD